MAEMAQWIRADGIVIDIEATDGVFTLEELQTLVDGEIEIVPVAGELVLVLNKDGLRKDQQDGLREALPVNAMASTLYTQNPPIFGDVVVCRAALVEKGN